MSSSSDSLVLSRPTSNPYASLIARRRPAPAPVDIDFTVRLSVWERGSCQTNSHLAHHIRFILQQIDGGGAENPNPWTVTALPHSIYPVGPWPRPIQVDISCHIIDIFLSKPSSLEAAYEDRMELVDWLFQHFRAYMSNQDYVEPIYSDRLIGFALNYPAIPNGETSYTRLNVQEFHLPEIKEWEKTKTEFVRNKFYNGLLLALDRVAEVVKAYKEMIQEIPNDTFPNFYAKGLAAAKAATGVLPDVMEKYPLLKDIDQSTIDDLIHQHTPLVKFIWGTAAGLIVFGSIILCAAPVTAPAAALTGSAMGSTAVFSTSVSVAGWPLAVAETAGLIATRTALSSGFVFKSMAGGALIGGFMSIPELLKEMESHNSMLNYLLYPS
ncbi:hypothetical protein BOTCAL_0631g00090 [Botryotinia calthae]|uniref:Uncharacterized protein n=1 Tax=Botryotinia calthae TaxID=38488 RepID=A0A4Y8CK33_9HELO|nr:hypothetical protein BOTCAL_0631g00090 [Botryotinia calthae]